MSIDFGGISKAAGTLFFDLDDKIMAARILSDGAAEEPRQVLSMSQHQIVTYDLLPDGRFLVVQKDERVIEAYLGR